MREAKNEAEFTSSKLGSGGGGVAGFIPARRYQLRELETHKILRFLSYFLGFGILSEEIRQEVYRRSEKAQSQKRAKKLNLT
ncbi:hypothetical protein CQA49_08070 [Helicobacter sp. MIT 00-7814]|nr:hypothetical protein CQA37_09220 [Helicobacter sp. MIT 99-10781]RDU52561.1 hypothetical protein CQA49_08070 [Helicobacter sp. MIT 00-7814]